MPRPSFGTERSGHGADNEVEAPAAGRQRPLAAVGRLPLGDDLPGGVVVERKAAADLVASSRDRRLFDLR